MTDFADRARAALQAKGLSLRGAARALPYDVAYLSRVLNGKQQPSERLALALDDLVEADGELAGLASPARRSPEFAEAGGGIEEDIAYVRRNVAHLLEHDQRHGGDQIAPAAVQVWHAAQRKLDAGMVPDRMQREYVTAVAEAAEVSGWLLFDAGRPDAARAAFLEADGLARQVGDRAMSWFAQDMLAMVSIQEGRPGEAVRIADGLQGVPRIPPRVELLTRIRRGRAFASIGERGRALNEIKGAWAGLGDSIGSSDPAWTWWVDELELSGHEGEVYLALGEIDKALPRLHRARELAECFRPAARGVFYYTVSMLEAYAAGRAWRACEGELMSVPALLAVVSSGRSRQRLRTLLDRIAREPDTPRGLLDLTRDIRTDLRI